LAELTCVAQSFAKVGSIVSDKRGGRAERKPVVVEEKRMRMWYSTSGSCLPLTRDSSREEKERKRKKEEIGDVGGGCGWMCIPAG